MFNKSGPIAYVLMGLPGSGKTTVRKTLGNATILSTDDYIEDYARRVGKTYDEVFKDTYKEASSNMWNNFFELTSEKLPLIWDQTNLTIKKRRIITNAIPNDYTKILVYLDTPLEICLEHNEERERTISPSIIENMWEDMEIPSIDEDFDMMIKVRYEDS